jgi:four helix bundle protein
MSKPPAPSGDKPYDLRERLFVFACDVVRISQKLHSAGPVAGALSIQLLRASVSAASNAEEADDGSSDRDFRAKKRICLREIKETRLRLRVLRATGFLDADTDPVIDEARQLC